LAGATALRQGERRGVRSGAAAQRRRDLSLSLKEGAEVRFVALKTPKHK
jgi:hypothetical protein